jgi:redox-sensitive bicupin YhaK (pirin superfamily)
MLVGMTHIDVGPAEETLCGGLDGVAVEPVRQLHDGVNVALGGPRAMRVTRTLPNRERRMVGGWCFVDYYGPDDISGTSGMRVPPHPHIGLQTVSWLVRGEVLHRDSLGSTQLVRPGQLNLMTAGYGISHSEESPPKHSAVLHGVQLWTALPGPDRNVDPAFDHHPELPALSDRDVNVTVIMGELGGVSSPARTYSPLVGVEVSLQAGADTLLPLQSDWEHAALTMAGSVVVDGVALPAGPLLYLGAGRAGLRLQAQEPGRVLLIGGAPFEERIVMWWNFVGRDHDEIVEARESWMNGEPRFGSVLGYPGYPLPAPAMPTTRLKPRGRQP